MLRWLAMETVVNIVGLLASLVAIAQGWPMLSRLLKKTSELRFPQLGFKKGWDVSRLTLLPSKKTLLHWVFPNAGGHSLLKKAAELSFALLQWVCPSKKTFRYTNLVYAPPKKPYQFTPCEV